jgi:uncharacterized protein YegL
MVELNDAYQMIPFYIICDESQSMEGSKLDACNTALPEIHKAIASDPIVNDKVRIGVISFSDSAEVLLPLSKMTDVVDFPGLVVKGGTNYGSAFTCLKQTIQDNITALKAENNVEVIRPIALFVSGSTPTDTEWRTAHAAIADKNWPVSPHIIAIGVGEAQTETIREVATNVGRSGTQFAYLADDNADLGAVLIEIFRSIIGSLIGAQIGPGGLDFPVSGSGFIKLDE